MKRDERNSNSFCRQNTESFWHSICSRDMAGAHRFALQFDKRFPPPSDRHHHTTGVSEFSYKNNCDSSYDAHSSLRRTPNTPKHPSTINHLRSNYSFEESRNSATQIRIDQGMPSEFPPNETILIGDNQDTEAYEDKEEFFQQPSFKNAQAIVDSELSSTRETPPRVGAELTGRLRREVSDFVFNQIKTSFNPLKDIDLHTSRRTSRSELGFTCDGDEHKRINDDINCDRCRDEKDKNLAVCEKNFVHGCLADTPVKFRIHEEETKLLTQTKCGVTVTLLNSSLWRAFNEIATEMIINRGGRRMFPFLALSVKGLEPKSYYSVNVQIIPAATRRFKYINMKWIPVGLADTEPVQIPYTHCDSPNTGAFWNSSKITFSKIKLTNNLDSAAQNILLHSMHKYKIVTTFTLLEESQSKKPEAKASLSFSFAETDFMAVTAYQNEAVTQLKIHNNPFAKAFRDANFSSMRRTIASRKRKHTVQAQERSKVHGDTQPTVCSNSKSKLNPLASYSGPPLHPYPSNDYSIIGNTGFRLTQTQSLLGIGNLSYCLPWGSFPIIPSSLCSRLFPFPASQYSSSFAAGEQFLATKWEAPSRQVRRVESSSISAIEKM